MAATRSTRSMMTGQDENAIGNLLNAKQAKPFRAASTTAGQPPQKRQALMSIDNTLQGRGGLADKGKGKLASIAAGVTSRRGRVTLGTKTSSVGAKDVAAAGTAALQTRTRALKTLSSSLPETDVGHALAGMGIDSCNKKKRKASEVRDIDAAYANDQLYVVEYLDDIFAYAREAEVRDLPDNGYMARQPHINNKMRSILIDWLIEVHLKFRLREETLHSTVYVLDRYLARAVVERRQLQLIGIGAMFIACKIEEIWTPEVRDFVYISDRAYTREEILAIESVMLNALGFNCTDPTPYFFLDRFLKAAQGNDRTALATSYLVELALENAKFIGQRPSKIAATCVMLATRRMHAARWNATMEHYTSYSEAQLEPLADLLLAAVAADQTSQLRALQKKYRSAKFGNIASVVASWV